MATGGMAPARTVGVKAIDLLASWRELDSADHSQIDLVALGNPHFSLTECAKLAELCEGREKDVNVRIALTLGRAVHEQARVAGYISRLEKFGALLINDT